MTKKHYITLLFELNMIYSLNYRNSTNEQLDLCGIVNGCNGG